MTVPEHADAATDAEIHARIDATGLLCPLPVLKARKRLLSLAPGQVLRLIATDPASWIDVPHFCAEAGHDLLSARDEAGLRTYLIRRGPAG
jgi:tRNA 2-thiouridine synthesizing protein A